MKRPRDFQRQKVYSAERNLKELFGTEFQLSEAETFKFIIDICIAENQDIPQINLATRINSRTAKAGSKIIKLPERFRSKLLICHELAHTFTFRKYNPRSISGHGPEWVTEYIRLTNKYISSDLSIRLMLEFLKSGIKFTNAKDLVAATVNKSK